MYGNAFPSSAVQQQSQSQQPRGIGQTTGNSGAGMNSNTGQYDFSSMMGMGMSGALGGVASAGGINGMLGGMSNLDGSMGAVGSGTSVNPALMFNPQLQALLQQQMVQQQSALQPQQSQQQQQALPQQQQIRWPTMAQQTPMTNQAANLGYMQSNQSGITPQNLLGNAAMLQQQQQQQHSGNLPSQGAQFGQQPFNPFLQNQQQQQSQQMPVGGQQANFGAQAGGATNMNNLAAAYLAQAQQQQQQQQQRQRAPGSAVPANILNNASAFMGLGGAGNGGMIDPNSIMQSAQYKAMQQAVGNGAIPSHMQMQQQSQMQHSPQLQNQTPTQPSPKPSIVGTATPEPKAKGRPKGSTKKKKEEAARLLQQQQQMQQYQQQKQQQGNFQTGAPFGQGSAPSPAPSFQPTPTPSHASITSHASSNVHQTLTLQQQQQQRQIQQQHQYQDRAGSSTRSPNLSDTIARTGSASFPTNVGNHAVPAAGINNNGIATRNVPSNWVPSLSAAQQQQLLGQALSFSKAQSTKNTSGQQTPSPAHILMQLGYVYVKAAVLPNNGQGAGIPGNGASGAGAVLSINEARMIGILPQPAQSLANASSSQQGSNLEQQQAYQQQQQLQQQQQPASSSTLLQQTSQRGEVTRASMNSQINQQSQAMAPPTAQHLQQAHQQQQGQNQNQMQGQNLNISSVTPRLSGAVIPGSSQANMHNQVSSSPMGHNGKRTDGIRARQASTSSKIDPIQGTTQMLGSDNSTQANAFATSGLLSSQQQQQNQQQMMIQQTTSQQMNRVGAASVVGPPLPPVEGGPLPKETPIGLEIAEYNTRLTPLPPSHILTSDASRSALEDLWKPLTKMAEKELIDIMGKDSQYTKTMNVQSQRNNAILSKKLQELRPMTGAAGGQLHWWERGVDEDQSQLGKDGPFENFKILLPADKRNHRASLGIRSTSLPSRSTKQITLERQSASQFEEDLVPVRLELEHEGWILRDTFTWPAPESFKTELVERFAVILCEDFGLPTASFVSSIRENILSQVSDHTAAEAIRPMKSKRKRDECMGKGRLSDYDENWWKQWRIKLKEDNDSKEKIAEIVDEDKVSVMNQGSKIDSNNCFLNNENEAEMRIQIKIDITVGAMNLVDHFEWDISDEGSSAEEFASVFTADLGLSGEFRTAVAHSIREQVGVYIRSLALVGYTFDGKEVLDDELREPLLGAINSIVRGQYEIDLYTPKLMQLSELEILHSEREREKELRRKRRQTRGRRGVNLPDREPLKTSRTPAIFGLQTGQQNLDALNGSSLDAMQNRQGGAAGGHASVTGIRGLAGMSTRRAAAAAANANIAPHSTGIYDHGTPTPQPESSHITSNGRRVQINAKRKKIESQGIHFEFPGGLGRGEEEDAENRGPKFAPSIDSNRKMVEQSAELGNAPSMTSHLLPLQLGNNSSNLYNNHGSAAATITTASSAGPVAWNMAKPEEAATQHPNWHDGQWHCSNCGVPGLLDQSRRKGPLGDKTLCGICGKFFHRHRKARPVEYTRDVAFHRRELAARGIFRSELLVTQDDGNLTTQSQSTHDSPSMMNTGVEMEGILHDSTAKKTQSIRRRNLQEEDDDDDDDDDEQEEGGGEEVEEAGQAQAASKAISKIVKLESFPNTRGNSPDLPFEQVGSPDDSDSSDTSRPTSPSKKGQTKSEFSRSNSPGKPVSATNSIFAAQQKQHHRDSLHNSPNAASPPPSVIHSSSSISAPISNLANSASTITTIATPAPTTTSGAISPPNWLSKACHTLRLRFPLDRFEVLLRPRPAGSVPSPLPEWRVRCQDCPGKLYTPGPEESLTNFEIHLKNRAHRANVQKAVQMESRKPYGS